MNPFQIHADGLNAVMAEQGDDCPQFIWRGKQWPIIPGTALINKPLRDGGFSNAFDLSFTTTVSQFDMSASDLADELANQPIGYLDVIYRVATVNKLAGGTIIQVIANSSNQNA